MKGSLAACMTAAKTLAGSEAMAAGSLVVAAVADEEYGSLGTAAVIQEMKADAAIVAPAALFRKLRLDNMGRLLLVMVGAVRACFYPSSASRSR